MLNTTPSIGIPFTQTVMTPTEGQTVINTVSYWGGYVTVHINGAEQTPNVDFTASDGTNIIFATPLSNLDIVKITKYNIDVLNVNSADTLDGIHASGFVQTTKIKKESPSGTKNGVNQIFALSGVPVMNSLLLFINGVLMEEGVDADYTLSGTVITTHMSSIPISSDIITAFFVSV